MDQELGSKLREFKEQTKNDKAMLNEMRNSSSKSPSLLPPNHSRLSKIKEGLVSGDEEMKSAFGDESLAREPRN